MKNFQIEQHHINPSSPCLIVAELSANHNQSYDLAIKTISAAKAAGADAIKLQTYTADTITLDSNAEPFQIKHGTIWDGTTLHQLYQKAFTPWEWHAPLKKHAEDLGLLFFSTPFDPTAVDFLESLNVSCYKVASFEIHDLPLIKKIAQTQKPVIMSTGIASLGDIEEATRVLSEFGSGELCLLKCTSAYPAPLAEINLKTMPVLGEIFNCHIGISDHTLGGAVSTAAVALGAKIIEKHFILDRSLGGEDSSFSMEPDEFKQMVHDIRTIEQALGKVEFGLTESTKINKAFGRSLFVCEQIKKGEVLSLSNIRSVRPAGGLPPKFLDQVLGKKARRDLEFAEPLQWDMLE
jgi:pseudaminic acid synthase